MTEEILPPPAIDVADASYVVTVEFKGHQFKLPASGDDWPYKAGRALMRDNDLFTFLEAVLGDQVDVLESLNPSMGEIGEFVTRYMEKIGAGNS